ncbi:MAG: hypothetical protein II767_00280, partial [Proteobacteria bacterium]|nr:hypothetical protein [Pseudomonadota bacterium]
YHPYDGACEADSMTNCGAHGKMCNIANATNTCSGGECIFTCNANYHLYNGACEVDSAQNCSKHAQKCAANSVCKEGKCDSTYNIDYHIGDIITFGHYEQDTDTSNGK